MNNFDILFKRIGLFFFRVNTPEISYAIPGQVTYFDLLFERKCQINYKQMLTCCLEFQDAPYLYFLLAHLLEQMTRAICKYTSYRIVLHISHESIS